MKALLLALSLAALAGCGRSFVPYTPPAFVDLGDHYPEGEYRAATADKVVLGVRAFDNKPRGNLPFWSRVLERRLGEMGGYALIDKRDVAAQGGLTGVAMRFGHDEGRTPFLYTVALFVTAQKVYLVEAGGEKDEYVKVEPQIQDAMTRLAPK
jgi:predicted small lipoprotein YifL